MTLLFETLDAVGPWAERGANTPSDQLRFAARVIKSTAADARRTTIETYQSYLGLDRARKFGRAIWAAIITGYTLADDIPSGALYSAVEVAGGLPTAVAVVSVSATALAGGLAHNQLRRMDNVAEDRGSVPLIEDNRNLGTDLLSVYGMGAPATAALYPRGTKPTKGRVAVMSAFYGVVGQGITYAGAQTAGEIVGVSPRVAVATAIGGVLTHRFAREAMNDPELALDTIGQAQDTEYSHQEEILEMPLSAVS